MNSNPAEPRHYLWARFASVTHRLGVAIALVAMGTLVSADWLPVRAQKRAAPKFRLELEHPNGGREIELLEIHQPTESALSEVSAGGGPQGAWVEQWYVISQFEVLSIRNHCVVLRFRSGRFKGSLNPQSAHQLDRDQVPWQTTAYVPGERVRISIEAQAAQPLIMSGSVVYE